MSVPKMYTWLRGWKDKPQSGEEMREIDKRLGSEIYKELLTHNKEKTNNPIKNWAEDLNRLPSKEDMQTENKHMQGCSTWYIIGDMQIKMTMRYSYTPIRTAQIQNTNNQILATAGSNRNVTRRWWEPRMARPLLKIARQFQPKPKLKALNHVIHHHAPWYLP